MRQTLRLLCAQQRVTLVCFRSDYAGFKLSTPPENCVFIAERYKSALPNMFWQLWLLPRLLARLEGEAIFLPAGNRRVMAWYPKPTLVTVHDLAAFHVPAKYDPLRLVYIKHVLPFFLRRAPQILAISEQTRQDLERFYRLHPERITIAHNGYHEEVYTPGSVSESQNYLQTQFQVPADFLLYVSRLEHPGKNHLNLLKAYAQLPAALRQKHPLVLAGADWSGAEVIHQSIASLGLSKQVHCLGFVPAEALPHLYRAACLYVFPSLYEGFGIPLLEAMACGVPVTCANCGALPEVGGNAVQLFDPLDLDALKMHLQALLEAPERRSELRQLGLERVQHFSWQAHVETILTLLQTQIQKRV